MKTQFSRHHILRGTGALIALPALESIGFRRFASAAVPGPPPKRMIFLGIGYGVTSETWFPDINDKGAGYKLPEGLKPLARHKKDFTNLHRHLPAPRPLRRRQPSAGYFSPWLDVKRIQDVPLWIFHGKPDKVVDYMGSRHVFDQLKKLNGNTKFTTLPGVGHGSQNSSAFRYTGDDPEKGYITKYASDRCDKTDHVWNWLFRQKRSR